MKRWGVVALALVGLLTAFSAQAAEKRKTTLGVFLPTSMTDAQERFRFAEKLAAGVGAALGEPVVGRSFGRYEDFAKAASDGSLDIAVVDGWAAAEAAGKFEPLALGVVDGETHPAWAVVSTGKGVVKDLKGKKLAVIKGSTSTNDAKFVTNIVFGGDLEAQKHFGKLVPVPSVESALKVLEVKSADAILIPAMHAPKGAQVLFRSGRVLGAVVMATHARAADVQTALKSLGAVEPFDRFVEASPNEVADFKRLLQSGPPRRQPVVSESPLQRLEPSVVLNPREVGPVLPSFIETMEIAREQPDD